MRALPWLLVAIVTVAMSSGLADVPGWLAPDDYAPTSGACVAVMRPLPGIVDLVGLGGLLVLAFLGITRGGPILAPLAAFSIASTVVVVAVLANADGKARIERASMTAPRKFEKSATSPIFISERIAFSSSSTSGHMLRGT